MNGRRLSMAPITRNRPQVRNSLVQAHGGTVGIESTAEAGTTVSVFLPTRGPSVEAPRNEAMRMTSRFASAPAPAAPLAPNEEPA